MSLFLFDHRPSQKTVRQQSTHCLAYPCVLGSVLGSVSKFGTPITNFRKRKGQNPSFFVWAPTCFWGLKRNNHLFLSRLTPWWTFPNSFSLAERALPTWDCGTIPLEPKSGRWFEISSGWHWCGHNPAPVDIVHCTTILYIYMLCIHYRKLREWKSHSPSASCFWPWHALAKDMFVCKTILYTHMIFVL